MDICNFAQRKHFRNSFENVFFVHYGENMNKI